MHHIIYKCDSIDRYMNKKKKMNKKSGCINCVHIPRIARAISFQYFKHENASFHYVTLCDAIHRYSNEQRPSFIYKSCIQFNSFICLNSRHWLFLCTKKKIAIAGPPYNSYWTVEQGIWAKRNSERHKKRTNLIYITVSLPYSSHLLYSCGCDCVCVALQKVHFPPPTLSFNFLMLSAKNHGSFAPHMCSPLYYQLQQQWIYRASRLNGKKIELDENETGRSASLTIPPSNSISKIVVITTTTVWAAHVMCARKTLVLFIFWCYFLLGCVCVFFPEFALKIRFVFHLVSRWP